MKNLTTQSFFVGILTIGALVALNILDIINLSEHMDKVLITTSTMLVAFFIMFTRQMRKMKKTQENHEILMREIQNEYITKFELALTKPYEIEKNKIAANAGALPKVFEIKANYMDVYRDALDKFNKRIKFMRFYGETLEMFDTDLRTNINNNKISDCEIIVLIRQPKSDRREKFFTKTQAKIVIGACKKWKALETDFPEKNIKVKIVYHNNISDYYSIIFNDELLITDVHTKIANIAGASVNPMVFRDYTDDGKEIISRYINQFDYKISFYAMNVKQNAS